MKKCDDQTSELSDFLHPRVQVNAEDAELQEGSNQSDSATVSKVKQNDKAFSTGRTGGVGIAKVSSSRVFDIAVRSRRYLVCIKFFSMFICLIRC